LKAPPVITLISDFGTRDPYVGLMKGALLSVNPAAVIVDITHEIAPGGIRQAAFLLAAAHPYFPRGAVHVGVVDPGVGSSRRILGFEAGGCRFLGPDNGLLSRVVEALAPTVLYEINSPRYFRSEVSPTFHGRDVFAPVAAHLSLGLAWERLGPRVPPEGMVLLPAAGPRFSETGELVGSLLWADRFGNLVSDIDCDDLEPFLKGSPPGRISVEIGGKRIRGLSRTYSDVGPGDPLALFGSFGFLEAAVNGGSAAERFSAGPGDEIRVSARTGEGA